MNKTSIGHIMLNVKDLNISEIFYDAILKPMGFEFNPIGGSKNIFYKSYSCGDANIWLRCDKNIKSEIFVRNVGLDHLALKVQDIMKVDEIFKILKENNSTITRVPRKYPEYTERYYAICFRDPDNIPIEVYYD